MQDDLERIERDFAARLAAAGSERDSLESLRVAFLGKKGELQALLKQLGRLGPEERPAAGQAIHSLKQRVEDALASAFAEAEVRRTEREIERERIDVTLPPRKPWLGSLHPVTHTRRELERIFVEMGFTIETGPEVEDDFHNFQALNIPPDHPARTMKDSLYVSVPGHPELLLRTETSAVQIRTMRTQPPPVYVVAPGRVFRRETPDATHSPVFHQVEGLAVDEGITFADLKGTLEAAVKALFGERRRVRLGPAFFPFVEPGCEVGVSCFKCDGAGCRICGNGWIELLGAGMVHPRVLENCGYDSERYTGFAFGLGIDRVALLKYAIPDIRMLFDGDVRFLAQFEGVA